MFTPTALIQFVFTNETDDIFWDSLFRADINKYLFFRLHDKFEITYFVDLRDDKPVVISYGESNAKQYKNPLFKSVNRYFAEWLLEQLERKNHPCAVVFRLESFCSLLEGEKKTLKKIAESYQNNDCKGSIILIASNNADKNSDYLFSSPVFEYLNEKSVLKLSSQKNVENIYLSLKSSKQEACVFLNNYTRERMTDLVSYVALEYKNRYLGKEKLRLMSNYLTRYLNRPDMRMREHKLFKGDFPLLCPTYKEIYEQLQNENIWTELYHRSMDHERNRPGELDDYKTDRIVKKFQFIRNDESIQTKCMKLCIPGAIYDTYDNNAINNLNEIYEISGSPGNREINSAVSGKIDSLFTKLDNVRHNGDEETCSRIIMAILCCVNCLYVEKSKQDGVLEKIRILEMYIELSKAYFQLRKNYNPSSLTAQLDKNKIDLFNAKLQTLDDTVNVIKSNLTDAEGNFERISMEISSTLTSSDLADLIFAGNNNNNHNHTDELDELCDFSSDS